MNLLLSSLEQLFQVSTESKMQKKSMDVHDHFINTFIKRLERKQQRWIKVNRLSTYLCHILALYLSIIFNGKSARVGLKMLHSNKNY